MKKKVLFPSLHGKIIEYYGSLGVFANAIGWAPAKLSTKLHGKSEWSRGEMLTVLEKLNLPLSEILQYFFAKEVQDSNDL